MKNYYSIWALVTAGLLAFVSPTLAQTVDTNATIAKTSFSEVTSQLDPGGDFYLYLSTAQWLEHLSGTVEQWRSKVTAMPNANTNDIDNINKGFDLIGHLIQDSGIQDLSGFGMSSIETEPGLYRTKMLLHHYPGKNAGFLWKFGGVQPHPLTGLDLLPDNTALALFSDTDIPLMWSVVEDEVARSGIPQAQDAIRQVPDQFEKATKIGWTTFLHSLGGEIGIVLTLNESNRVPIPLPSGLILTPEPGLFIALRVNDDTIFNRVAEELKTNQDVIVMETNGVKMRTMPVPLPLAMDLRPTVASSGGYLFIASSDTLIQEALAVKAGTVPGLKDTAEFKRLAQHIPDQGNQFCFMSRTFGRTVADIQQQAMAAQQTKDPAQAAWMQSLFNSHRTAFSYCVGANTPDGYLSVGNGSHSGSALVLVPVVAVPAVGAAMLLPALAAAKDKAGNISCINNLRQIDSAKNQWALEHNKTVSDTPTEDDIKPYLSNERMPVCPQGGTYTIGAMSEKPQCSITGHVLP